MTKTKVRSKSTLSKKSESTRELSFSRFIPNIATVAALCAGLTGIHFTLQGRYEAAVFSVLIAGILDVLDGRLARMLGAESDFGAQMDSLSDFVCFGVVPGVMIYASVLQSWKGWGWGICLFYVVCACWRLARFNTMLSKPDVTVYKGRFMGMPAPMGAYVALLPLMVGFSFGVEHPLSESIFATTMILSGLLMVSAIPTIATKTFKFSKKNIFPIFLLFSILVVAILNAPWEVLSVIGFAYLGYIPFGYVKFRKEHAQINDHLDESDLNSMITKSKK